ncbi:BBSome complex assembly protein BBS10 [Ambystoma mexicanum]|uniref:BBSome complex assembly protein BBS10 n=1 Tax=Ambystoma mexicanum TaxID=8296 RepID=UPI0037E7AB29
MYFSYQSQQIKQMIVDCASRLYRVTGDGTKAFIMLLCDVLRGLEKVVKKKGGGAKHRGHGCALKRICQSLMQFQMNVLARVMGTHVRPHFISVFTFPGNNSELCKDVLKSTLEAYFFGKIGKVHTKYVAEIALDFVSKCVVRDDCKDDVVSLLDDCFLELHTAVTGLPVGRSTVLPGLVLHRDFAVFCPAEGDIRALVLTEPVNSRLSTNGFDLAVTSEEQFVRFEVGVTKRTESFMKHLQICGVNLILSSVKQSETALYYAKQSCISVVHCLSEEDIALLCRVTVVAPESKPSWELLRGEVTSSLTASFCKPILLGSHRYVHLGVTSTTAFDPHCVVLCGPVKGLTQQHVSAFQGALKMLRQLFKAHDVIGADDEKQPSLATGDCYSSTSKQQEIHNKGACRQGVDLLGRTEAEGLNNECDTQNNVQVKAIPNAESKCYVALSEMEPMSCTANSFSKLSLESQAGKNVQENIGQGDNCTEENSTFHITQQLRSMSNEPETICRRVTCMQRTARASGPHRYSESFIPAGSLLPVGGTLEILLHYYLHEHAAQSRHGELALVTTLFADALLCIPRNIHRTPMGNAPFLRAYSAVIGAVRANTPVMKQKGFESVACKYELLASVLHCAAKLVTIDLVIGVKKAPPNMDEDSDSEL